MTRRRRWVALGAAGFVAAGMAALVAWCRGVRVGVFALALDDEDEVEEKDEEVTPGE